MVFAEYGASLGLEDLFQVTSRDGEPCRGVNKVDNVDVGIDASLGFTSLERARVPRP